MKTWTVAEDPVSKEKIQVTDESDTKKMPGIIFEVLGLASKEDREAAAQLAAKAPEMAEEIKQLKAELAYMRLQRDPVSVSPSEVAVKPNDLLGRLEAYRTKLFAAIKRELEIDGHCKSYEGRVELNWPCYFGGEYSIHVACYVLGPLRGYDYYGETWDECFDKAEADLESWIKENREADGTDTSSPEI